MPFYTARRQDVKTSKSIKTDPSAVKAATKAQAKGKESASNLQVTQSEKPKTPAKKAASAQKVNVKAESSPASPPVVTAAKKTVPAKVKAASPAGQQPVSPTPATSPVTAKTVKASSAKKEVAAAPPAKSMNVSSVETTSTPSDPVEAVAVAAPDQLVRATRPSARLAQITVPSLPPAVASTAAKSSFLPSSPSPSVAVTYVPVKKDPKLANNWKTKKASELCDAEILAMPDDEYMNDTQMAFFRLKLTRLKQDILNSAGQTTEHLREDTVVVPDPADRATIEEEHALELRTRDRERKLLKKIEQSIVRIDAGDYGFCDETGESIGVGRLLARPTATLSLEAQQRRELKQKMFGD
jgi:DnaK suppressor protein